MKRIEFQHNPFFDLLRYGSLVKEPSQLPNEIVIPQIYMGDIFTGIKQSCKPTGDGLERAQFIYKLIGGRPSKTKVFIGKSSGIGQEPGILAEVKMYDAVKRLGVAMMVTLWHTHANGSYFPSPDDLCYAINRKRAFTYLIGAKNGILALVSTQKSRHWQGIDGMNVAPRAFLNAITYESLTNGSIFLAIERMGLGVYQYHMDGHESTKSSYLFRRALVSIPQDRLEIDRTILQDRLFFLRNNPTRKVE